MTMTKLEWKMKYQVRSFKEECYFLYGVKILGTYIGFLRYHSIGKRTEVKFNWKKVIGSKFLLGFFHSHPPGSLYCSKQDRDTMWAWVRAEGRPLICGIICEKEYLTFIFTKDMMFEIFSVLFGRIFIGR